MRNKALDQLRFLAAIFVVLIHSPLPGTAEVFIEALARIAVPLFFMISGYYASNNNRATLIRKMKKTAVMLGIAVALYFAWEMLWSIYHGTTAEKLQLYFSIQTLAETIVLNTGVLLGHLWFLLALLYCYCIYAFCMQRASLTVRLGIAMTLLAGFFLVKELFKWNGVSDPVYYVRNFLLMGLPFFLLGEAIKQKKEWLLSVKPVLLAIVAIVGLGAAITERLYVGCCDLYFGTVLTVVAIFILVQRPTARASCWLAKLGKQYAGDIYIIHVMLLSGLNMVASITGILSLDLFLIMRPVVLVVLCILLSGFKNNLLKKKH